MNNRLRRLNIWFILGGPLQRAGIWLMVLVVIVCLWAIFFLRPGGG